MCTTFSQIPLLSVARGLTDGRFMTALLIGTIYRHSGLSGAGGPLGCPALTCGIGRRLAGTAGALHRLVYHFYSTRGQGDAPRAVAAAPLLLLVQMVALPIYLWLFLGSEWFHLALSTSLIVAFRALSCFPWRLPG